MGGAVIASHFWSNMCIELVCCAEHIRWCSIHVWHAQWHGWVLWSNSRLAVSCKHRPVCIDKSNPCNNTHAVFLWQQLAAMASYEYGTPVVVRNEVCSTASSLSHSQCQTVSSQGLAEMAMLPHCVDACTCLLLYW